jgi:DNA-binding GntR family transcriptional regulator
LTLYTIEYMQKIQNGRPAPPAKPLLASAAGARGDLSRFGTIASGCTRSRRGGPLRGGMTMSARGDAAALHRPASGLQPKSLVDYIVESLERDILEGVLEPGERIIEAVVCEKLGVSRSPLREAFRRLETRGFVVHQPRKGVSVARLSLKEARDIYVIRASLESLATRLAVERGDPAVLQELKTLNQQMIDIAESEDLRLYFPLNKAFHEALVGACGNERLIRMIDQFEKQTQRYRLEVLSTKGRIRESARKHAALIELFEKGDAAGSESLRRESILSNIPLLREKLMEDGNPDEN